MKPLLPIAATLILLVGSPAMLVAQSTAVTKNPNTGALLEDLTVPSGRALILDGTLSGTPAGGTLDLSALTLSLPVSAVTAHAGALFNAMPLGSIASQDFHSVYITGGEITGGTLSGILFNGGTVRADQVNLFNLGDGGGDGLVIQPSSTYGWEPITIKPLGNAPVIIADELGNPVIEAGDGTRRLYSGVTGSQSLDWENCYLYDYSGNPAIQWGDGQVNDASGFPVLNWQASQAFAGPWSAIVMDWSNQILYDLDGYPTVQWASRILADSEADLAVDWESRLFFDSNSVTSVDWGYRSLSNSAGQSVFLWDNGGEMKARVGESGFFQISNLSETRNSYIYPPATGSVDADFVLPSFDGEAMAFVTKTDAGNPSQSFEGMIVINTADNTVKIYADGAWRTLATW